VNKAQIKDGKMKEFDRILADLTEIIDTNPKDEWVRLTFSYKLSQPNSKNVKNLQIETENERLKRLLRAAVAEIHNFNNMEGVPHFDHVFDLLEEIEKEGL
jgi:histidyl-tRNA synthetase